MLLQIYTPWPFLVNQWKFFLSVTQGIDCVASTWNSSNLMQSHSAELSRFPDQTCRPTVFTSALRIHFMHQVWRTPNLQTGYFAVPPSEAAAVWSANYSGISLPLIWLASGSLSGYRSVLKMKHHQSYKTTDQSWTIITFCVRNAWRHVIFWKLRVWQRDWIRFVRISAPLPPTTNPSIFSLRVLLTDANLKYACSWERFFHISVSQNSFQ